jgi:hypothetical protein
MRDFEAKRQSTILTMPMVGIKKSGSQRPGMSLSSMLFNGTINLPSVYHRFY